jgi:hypothetical protein
MKTQCKNKECGDATPTTYIVTSGINNVQSHLTGVCRPCAEAEKNRLKYQRFYQVRIRHEDAVFPTWPSKLDSEDPNSEWWSFVSEPAHATA